MLLVDKIFSMGLFERGRQMNLWGIKGNKTWKKANKNTL